MEQYVARRRGDGVKDNSIAREITDIKAILNWSTHRRPPSIPFNPVRDFKGPSTRDEIIKAISRLLTTGNSRNRLACSDYYFCTHVA